MDVTLNIDGTRRRVTCERDGEGWRVAVDGREYSVTDVNSVEGTLAFLMERRSYVAHVSDGDGGVRISIRGRNHRLVEESMDADRPAAGATAGDGRVTAPMPGNITAVHAAEGDAVAAGTPVAVLESMKMMNEIVAPFDGVVERVYCRAGDQVAYGAVLAEIAPRDKGARKDAG
jgi:geranyl-CoA carboxylase alpha subunit